VQFKGIQCVSTFDEVLLVLPMLFFVEFDDFVEFGKEAVKPYGVSCL